MSVSLTHASKSSSAETVQASQGSNQLHSFFSSLKVLTHATATPITNLLINLELLERDISQATTHANCSYYLSKAILSAQYLKEIMQECTNNPLCVKKRFIVKDSIREMLQICKNPEHRGQLVSYLQLTGQESLTGNKLYFQELLICLINNAFQAYQSHDSNQLVVVTASQDGTMLKIRVVDGGSGFLELNDSLKKHQNTSSKSGGTGLRFVRQVMLDHFGGSVNINSTCHKGSCVECVFPLYN